jgi:antirestriction protein ArdC
MSKLRRKFLASQLIKCVLKADTFYNFTSLQSLIGIAPYMKQHSAYYIDTYIRVAVLSNVHTEQSGAEQQRVSKVLIVKHETAIKIYYCVQTSSGTRI